MQVVVAGALIEGAAVLLAERRRPAELAGRWELPGGKVAEGETEPDALTRELHEELGIEVDVGPRLGPDVHVGEALVLRAYRVTRTGGVLHNHDHGALQWVSAGDLAEVDWVPADRAWIPALEEALAKSVSG